MRLHLSINHNLLLIFTFLENAFVCAFIVYVLKDLSHVRKYLETELDFIHDTYIK